MFHNHFIFLVQNSKNKQIVDMNWTNYCLSSISNPHFFNYSDRYKINKIFWTDSNISGGYLKSSQLMNEL